MTRPKVIVVDYGLGNLLSVSRGLEHCGADVTLSNDPTQIRAASHVVLPGVGAFFNGMLALKKLDLVSIIREIALRGTPLLGICLGMQLFLDKSEEFGVTEGLGLISGHVMAIPGRCVNTGKIIKIPHIGWNGLVPVGKSSWDGTWLTANKFGDEMYFVHSFMAVPKIDNYRIADCIYGGHRIASVIARDNIMGCQFHPEKSGELGLKILREFLL